MPLKSVTRKQLQNKKMEEESKIIQTALEQEAILPTYASKDAAGADVRAYIKQDLILNPGEIKLIPTGLRFAIPSGYEIQLRPRSGLALKHGVTLVNSPGTIDADYRGEIGIILINHGKKSFTVTPGMRIAQIVLAPVHRAQFAETEKLFSTSRGEGGFGHTGTH